MAELDNVREYWNVLSESVPDEFKDHWVDADGTCLRNDLFEEVADYLVARCPCDREARILEVGCGTGRILHQLAIRFDGPFLLHGIDFSQSQIDAARARLESTVTLQACDPIEFAAQQGGDLRFDLVFVHSVTQYFVSDEYFSRFLQSVYSLLSKGGTFMMLDCPVSWYKEHMTRPASGIAYRIRQIAKRILGYERTHMRESIGGKVLTVPAFAGYWVDPDFVRSFAAGRFQEFVMEYQSFENKPIAYRKYRPNILLRGRLGEAK